MDLADLRRSYESEPFDVGDADPDPYHQFARWFAEAAAAGSLEPNAAVLATADANGRPSARHVLVKGVQGVGFLFYTNYASRKGRELAANPFGALVFTWAPLARQVVVEGPVNQVSAADSDAYFAQRPRGSQIGAWASRQSEPLDSRAALEDEVRVVEARFAGGPVPRPPGWGGYRLVAERVEFWQGRPSRLHDRIEYRPAAPDEPSAGPGGGWLRRRLSP